MGRNSIAIIAAMVAAAIISQFAGQARAAEAAWPPKGSVVRVPIVRDNWMSSVGGERYGNNGGSSRMKLKGRQEYSVFDFDPAPLKGRLITGALWHVRCVNAKDPLLRITVSTLASPWVEGTTSRYARRVPMDGARSPSGDNTDTVSVRVAESISFRLRHVFSQGFPCRFLFTRRGTGRTGRNFDVALSPSGNI